MKQVYTKHLIDKIKAFDQMLSVLAHGHNVHSKMVKGVKEFQKGCTHATVRNMMAFEELFYDELH